LFECGLVAAAPIDQQPRDLRRAWTVDHSTGLVHENPRLGYNDYTVMQISGHSSTRMLARYTHVCEERKVAALDLPAVDTDRAHGGAGGRSTAEDIAEWLRKNGGRQEARTPDLCVANAALSQLS